MYTLAIFITLFLGISSQKCKEKLTDSGRVCICDSAYCDTIPALQPQVNGTYQIYTTSKSKLGLELNNGTFTKHTRIKPMSITIDTSKTYQKIIGFGGAFTDSTGINVLLLPEEAQEKLLESYFGESGAGYSLGRVPIGGTDFSTRPYTYDDHPGDINLEKFALQVEDLTYKIPLISKAKALRGNGEPKLFGSAWTAPPWMKTNNATSGFGLLKKEYYQTWAEYAIKFFDAYAENGIQFWGMTTGNEPLDGFIDLFPLPDMGWTPKAANKWIGENLGPTIRNSSQYKDLKIILFDDNRLILPFVVPFLLRDPLTLQYADGVGEHWYAANVFPWFFLRFAKTDKKEFFLLQTEACNGYLHAFHLQKAVDLGSWHRGTRYIDNILKYLEHGASGWTDWNMVLDTEGGPSYIKNFVDAPIIVNSTAGEFYKQPMYYALAHFAKFVVPDSVRIGVKVMGDLKGLKSVAFIRPDDRTVVIVYNSYSKDHQVTVVDLDFEAEMTIKANSINTIIY